MLSPPETAAKRAIRLACILGVHALLIGGLATATTGPQLREMLTDLDLRVIEEQLPPPPSPVEPEKPRPQPATPLPPVSEAAAPPPALLTAAATSPAIETSAIVVPPQPPPPPEAAPAPMAASEPVTPAHFNADYLHNPAPIYPAASRRKGEQGTVVIRVLVDAQGAAEQVAIHRSSTFSRLDEAAAKAVRRWRFVPARRGEEKVEGWVLVPLVFRLESAPDHPR